MTTQGFFQNQFDPNFRLYFSDENVRYIQREVSRRMRERYFQNIELEYDYVRQMFIQTYGYWRGPQTLDELIEMVICNFVQDITTDIEWNARFNDYNPRTLYFSGTSLSRQEKVKLKPSYKWEFNINY